MAPWPWEITDLHSVVGRRVVLASSVTYVHRLPALLPAAERAAAQANTLAVGDKPPVYIVYLATTAEYERWFTIKHTASEAGVAVTLGTGDVEVLIRMPDADQTRLVGAGGVAAVIGHELGHVAALQEKSTEVDTGAAMFSGGDDDLVEGIAEYCSHTGNPASWAAARLANVRAYIRSGKCSGDAFLNHEATSSDGLTASAAYGIGYLTIRRLVQRFGLQRTLALWQQTENLPYALPDQASQAVFHAPWTSVNADLANTFADRARVTTPDRYGGRPGRYGGGAVRADIGHAAAEVDADRGRRQCLRVVLVQPTRGISRDFNGERSASGRRRSPVPPPVTLLAQGVGVVATQTSSGPGVRRACRAPATAHTKLRPEWCDVPTWPADAGAPARSS